MRTFWDLFAQSIILQSLLTVGFGFGALYLWVSGQSVPEEFLWVSGQSVPEELLQGLWVILGFWFGSKSQHAAQVLADKQKRVE